MYDYLIQRSKYETRQSDFDERMGDFIQVLKNTKEGKEPLESTSPFYKKAHLGGLFYGSERYHVLRKQINETINELSKKEANVALENFLEGLEKKLTDNDVAVKIKGQLRPEAATAPPASPRARAQEQEQGGSGIYPSAPGGSGA